MSTRFKIWDGPETCLSHHIMFVCVCMCAIISLSDLYSGWLAQALSSDLLVQFWLRSSGILPSNCSGDFRIYNMEKLAFQDPKITFVSMVDHSKWCVGTESDPGWACVGDMNRNRAEEHRGGGAVCCRDSAIWKAFYSLVQKYTDCDDTEYCAKTANCPKHGL